MKIALLYENVSLLAYIPGSVKALILFSAPQAHPLTNMRILKQGCNSLLLVLIMDQGQLVLAYFLPFLHMESLKLLHTIIASIAFELHP
jgi:uncharacterized membrane protein YqaE (UPF0057 family)